MLAFVMYACDGGMHMHMHMIVSTLFNCTPSAQLCTQLHVAYITSHVHKKSIELVWRIIFLCSGAHVSSGLHLSVQY